MTYDLIFMTTCIDNRYMEKLLYSIALNNNVLSVCVIVLLQNNVTADYAAYKTKNTNIILLYESQKLNLSVARNILVKYVRDEGILANYVMFPDDDSSFDSYFFRNFSRIIVGNSLINVFCTGTRNIYQAAFRKKIKEVQTSDFKLAMSVNMVLTYQTFMEVGYFDENMGVGALYGAGEDGDYFIRACQSSGTPFKIVYDLWNFHPASKDKYKLMSLRTLIKRYRSYGEGVIYLCYKHKLYSQAMLCIFSGIVGAFVALLSLNFKLLVARANGTYCRLSLFLHLCFSRKCI